MICWIVDRLNVSIRFANRRCVTESRLFEDKWMWQIVHTPNHLCWSRVKFDDVTVRITDRKNVLYRLLDFKCINQNFSKHAEWITLRMFFVVAEVTLNIRAQSSITRGEVAPLIPRHPWSLAVFFKINLLTKLLQGTRLCNAGISCISCVFGPSEGFFLSLLRFYGCHMAFCCKSKFQGLSNEPPIAV